jgi:glycosyltransferase involved in cell wall biosynthesis
VRILSLIDSLGHGGAETVATELVIGLGEHDHRFAHFSTINRMPVTHPFDREMEAAGVPVHDVHWNPRLGGMERVTQGGWVPDVVLVHWWFGDAWTGWLRAFNEAGMHPVSICVIHDSRGAPPIEFDWYVTVSPTQLPLVRDQRRVRVIPNGVDLRRFDGVERPPREPDAPVVIGRISTLREPKIPADWVRTLVAWDLPGVRWVIAGDGEMREPLAADVARLGAGGCVSMPGYVPRDQVPALLATFDIFCYLTGTAVECHPLALLEAAAAGLPIVAQPRGGIVDIVHEGSSGLLGATNAEICAHLQRLCADPELRANLGRGARQVAVSFSLDRQLDAYRLVLAEAVQAAGA